MKMVMLTVLNPLNGILCNCYKDISKNFVMTWVNVHNMCVCMCVCVCQLPSHIGLFATSFFTRLLCPRNSSGKNVRVGCHSHLQGVFQTLGSNPSLPHCRRILYRLSHQVKIIHDIGIYNYTLSQHLLITYYAPSTGQKMVIQQ